MKKLLLIACCFVLVLFTSCESESETKNNKCGVKVPIEDLPWLNDWISESIDSFSYSHTYFMIGNYNGETVIVNKNCHPQINYQSNVWDCQGVRIGYTNILRSEITEIELLWKASDDACVDFYL